MSDLAKSFIEESRAFLAEYFPKIERCVEGLTEEDVWWRPSEASNSIGNILLHLDGSTRWWLVSVITGPPSSRVRQQEFDERERIPRAELLDRLRGTLAEADAVLAGLDPETLLERRRTPRGEYTVMWAVYHAVEHFSMHTGQVLLVAKMRTP